MTVAGLILLCAWVGALAAFLVWNWDPRRSILRERLSATPVRVRSDSPRQWRWDVSDEEIE